MRPITRGDVAFVVATHRAHFPEGFLARLGPRFLTAYTRTFIGNPHARAYVAERSGNPVGFLVGIIDPVAHRRWLLRNRGARLLTPTCAAFAARPALAGQFVSANLRRYLRAALPVLSRRAGTSLHPGGAAGPVAFVDHVAVARSVRSTGAGTALLRRFVLEADAAGCARVELATRAGRAGAGHFYRRLGWRYTGVSSTPEGRLFACYELPLGPPARPGGAQTGGGLGRAR